MSNQNQCNFIGRMGRAIELRRSQSGIAVGNTSIAVSKKYKGEETTQWVRLIFFGKSAEIIEQYTDKGSLLRVTAEYQNRQYEKDGQRQYISEFIVNDFEFLGSKQDSQGGGKSQGNQGGQQQNQQGQQGNQNNGQNIGYQGNKQGGGQQDQGNQQGQGQPIPEYTDIPS